jgi:hypothetical protein
VKGENGFGNRGTAAVAYASKRTEGFVDRMGVSICSDTPFSLLRVVPRVGGKQVPRSVDGLFGIEAVTKVEP